MKLLLIGTLFTLSTPVFAAQNWLCQGSEDLSMPKLEMVVKGDARATSSVEAKVTSLSDDMTYVIKADEEKEIHDNGTLVTFYGIEDTFHDKYLLVINKDSSIVTSHVTDLDNKVTTFEYTNCEIVIDDTSDENEEDDLTSLIRD